MEWVETTGKTVEDAKEAALDQLGVAEDEAEFDIIEEPRPGLFGRLRSEARVRARVQPRAPRSKERRERRRRPARVERAGDGSEQAAPGARGPATPQPRAAAAARRDDDTRGDDEGGAMQEGTPVTIAEQGEVAQAFLRGLLEEFGRTASVTTREIDEDTVEVAATGDDLGLLVGHRGATLEAVQELARTVVQRQTGARQGRLLVDVAGYRQRRREALERFTLKLADEVKSSGARKVLEPMNASDRKVVHDTVNAIDGVRTISEGEDPRRRVVLLPDAGE